MAPKALVLLEKFAYIGLLVEDNRWSWMEYSASLQPIQDFPGPTYLNSNDQSAVGVIITSLMASSTNMMVLDGVYSYSFTNPGLPRTHYSII